MSVATTLLATATNSGSVGWTLVNTAVPWDAVQTAGDSKYMHDSGSGSECQYLYQCDFSSIASDAFIIWVGIYFRAYTYNGGTPGTLCSKMYDAGFAHNSLTTPFTPTTSWTYYTKEHTRPAGGDWVRADFTASAPIFAFVSTTGSGGALIAVDYGAVRVQWDHNVTICIPTMFSWLLPLLGAGLGLEHMDKIAKAFFRWTGRSGSRAQHLIMPNHYSRMLDELRSMKRLRSTLRSASGLLVTG